MSFIPSYINLYKSKALFERIDAVEEILQKCHCCPHKCFVDRKNGEIGICASGYDPVVSSYTPHFGEEPVISGLNGAGNIFFGNCNLRCIYCQNFEISQNWRKENLNKISVERLAEIYIELQSKNCHNIGLVSPTHFSAQILKSIPIAIKMGLNLPLIYNTNGYDSVEMLELFKDIIDIYLPDLKYGNNNYGKKYSNAPGYFDFAKQSVKEMFSQVGDELIFENNLLVRGLIIRHLVLPNDLSETEEVCKFISSELSPNVHISLMSQYFPVHKASREILLNRTIRASEYERALDSLEKYGLKKGWVQELESINYYRPEFDKNRSEPFSK